MGQRHNRRRLRGDRSRRRPPKASYDRRLEFIEGEDLGYSMDAMDESIRFGIDYDAEKEAASLQADLDRGDRYENECKKMEEEWSKLEEAQRRMFGGEVGDEALVEMGILFDEPTSSNDRQQSTITTPSDDILPRFRSRSGSTSVDPAQTVPEPGGEDAKQAHKNATTDEEDWELMDSTTWESGSEAWEILSDDS